MKEIIQQIIDCEENGRKLIAQAQAEADKAVKDAQTQADSIRQSNIEKIKAMAQQKKDESLKIVTAEKEKMLSEERAKNSALRQAREKDVPALAKKAFATIMKIEE
jgi:vacuolar-type H+-ATPase subunit H